jgi:hypothetical protein
MTILIANIGTSDLVVKIDGFDYYFPLDGRGEPNIDKSSLNSNEEDAWNEKYKYIKEFLCNELDVKEEKFFKPLTKKLLEVYKDAPERWHSRIRPGRIFGVVQAAREKFKLTQAYIFITDQSSEEFPEKDHQDSVYLFEILKKWFESEPEIKDFHLIARYIPKLINPAWDQDALLDYYYTFFHDINAEEDILVSIKGGTPLMQSALRIQAISSATRTQIFIDPILSVKKVLAGECSDCRFTSFWRYTRNQKYQTVIQLLERWDFDGAIKILGGWQKNLDFLIENEVIDEDLANSNDAIKLAIESLNIARLSLNLDIANAKALAKRHPSLDLSEQINKYDLALNFYTQCRIYWKLEQVAIFLSRMSSFYEEVLINLVCKIAGQDYLNEKRDGVRRRRVEKDLWDAFIELEDRDGVWKKPESDVYKLTSRYNKRNFVEVLIQFKKPNQVDTWKKIRDSLVSLDYWVIHRNNLIHNGDGISKETMPRVLAADKDNSKNNDLKNVARDACSHDKILEIMTRIYKLSKEISNTPPNNFLHPNGDYYIYSQAKDRAIQILTESSKAPMPASDPE